MDYTATFHYAPQENCSMDKLTVFYQVKKYLSSTEPVMFTAFDLSLSQRSLPIALACGCNASSPQVRRRFGGSHWFHLQVEIVIQANNKRQQRKFGPNFYAQLPLLAACLTYWVLKMDAVLSSETLETSTMSHGMTSQVSFLFILIFCLLGLDFGQMMEAVCHCEKSANYQTTRYHIPGQGRHPPTGSHLVPVLALRQTHPLVREDVTS